MIRIFLVLWFIGSWSLEESFAKVDSVKNLDLLREKEVKKSENYGFELNKGGVYFEPTIKSVGQKEIISNNSYQEQQENYLIDSNIGVDFNKYFTGFLSYDLGNIGIDNKNKDIDFRIDPSAIKVNGFGSKINVSDDFHLKVMYLEDDLESSSQQDNSGGKEQKMQLKGVVNF